MVSYRNPFYMELAYSPAPCPGIFIDIHSPVNGTTFYFPTQTLAFNTTNAVLCQYRIDSNSWNTVPCQYNNSITFPTGEVLVSVRGFGSLSYCTTTNTTYFEVVGKNDLSGYVDYYFMLWIFIGGNLTIIWMFMSMKRKKRKY